MTKLKTTHVGKTIQFPKDNIYFYGQDMCTFQSIPSGIMFEIVEKLQTKKYMLTANGYGKNPYGNGAIFVSEIIVNEMIERNAVKPVWTASYSEPKPTYISPGNPIIYPDEYIINGEPLSNKQLYEIITSKNITIDATFIRIDELMNTLKHIRKLLKVGHYNKAMKILDEIC